MLRWLESRVLWGFLLIFGGIIFLLQNLGLFQLGVLFWALLLGLGGVFFLAVFFQNRANWWALIPGFTLFSVASLVLLDRWLPVWSDSWGGMLVLGGIALSFIVIYLLDRGENWWAIIPGGVLSTLALVAGLEQFTNGMDMGALFFVGLGITFALVGFTPTPAGPNRWAFIPATILMVIGLLVAMAAEEWLGRLWPLFLVGAGGFLLLRSLFVRNRE